MSETALPLVLHVLPLDLARGPQRYARLVRDALDGEAARHRTLTLFQSEARVLEPDFKLDARANLLSRRGFDPRIANRLRRLLRELAPDQVIAYGSQPFKYLAAALPLRTKLVYRKIGVAHAPARRPLRRLFHSLLMRRASLVAGVSQECLDEAEQLFGVERARLSLVPNGRDPAIFFPAPKPPRERCLLTFVGHLTTEKRPELFVALIAKLQQEGLAVDGQIIGDGPMSETLRLPARAAGIALLGRRDDVPRLLRESDLLVATGLPDGEGMPGVFLEAGLSGLPCVTTAMPGATTAIAQGKTGFVVAINDTAELLRHTRHLVETPRLRASMGENARKHCLAHFTLERSLQRWRDVLGYGERASPLSR